MSILTPGTKVGLISPSSSLPNPQVIESGITYLRELGLDVVNGKNIYQHYRYMAGTPEMRAADIMDFYQNPEIKAIFATAGGEGAQFILPFLDYKIIAANPKPIIGFSDVTALQMAIYAQTGQPYYSGFLLKYDVKNGIIQQLQDQSLRTLLSGQKLKACGGECVTPGISEGILLGGCLSLFRNLCGTPYYPDLSGKILLIEDVEEKTYKLDLMLEQIRQGPNFKDIKGIVFGDFADCKPRKPEDGTINEVIDFFAKNVNIPIIRNFPYGHTLSHYVLPCGEKVRLNANKCCLEQL